MKLKTTLMMFSAALALSAGMAFAGAVTGQGLADQYTADGYTYVEVKVGPTQIKVEAIKDGTITEVVYDAATGEIIDQESRAAGAGELGQTGVDISTVDHDFDDGADGDDANDGDSDEGDDGADDGDDDTDEDDDSSADSDDDGDSGSSD